MKCLGVRLNFQWVTELSVIFLQNLFIFQSSSHMDKVTQNPFVAKKNTNYSKTGVKNTKMS